MPLAMPRHVGRRILTALTLAAAAHAAATAAGAQAFAFSTGTVDGRMALASRPGAPGRAEIEAADDFVLSAPVRITRASFIGLVPTGFTLSNVTSLSVEIYRVFPFDSDVGRTSGSPTFSTPRVPTRVNSPSDVALDTRTAGAGLTYTTTLLAPSFTAANSILNGINALPNVTTGGEGAVSGQEVRFDVTFTTPFALDPDHYFFVPQVGLPAGAGNFFWLSSARPIVAPGSPFAPDLQAWIRNAALDPDWLRAGTDVVGGATPPTYNAQFTLAGEVVPEPTTLALVGGALGVVALAGARRRAAEE